MAWFISIGGILRWLIRGCKTRLRDELSYERSRPLIVKDSNLDSALLGIVFFVIVLFFVVKVFY